MIDFTQFQKPQRYIGNEWNVVKKSHQDRIRICIAYPDLYEVGMSNLGLRIIYGLLNEYPDVICERTFMPGADLGEFLRRQRIDLFSLESKTPLKEFEVIGFNFNYELNFVNFLHILSLGNVPLRSEERRGLIVIGGGIGNPEPLAEFVDVFFLGEFEEAALKFIDILREYKDKRSRLEALAAIAGFYVPSFYKVVFQNNKYHFKKLYRRGRFPLERVYVKNLNKVYFPIKWLTPHSEIIHDRVPIEIARGCPNSCRFCQARALYFPYRQKKISVIFETIKEVYKNSGYEKFSFLALSATDYSSINQLVEETKGFFQENRINLSLPSLRPSASLLKLYKMLSSKNKASLTIALEAATFSLRKQLNKKIEINQVFEILEAARALNIRQIKVYFMFGFPQETTGDLAAIGEFLKKLAQKSGLLVNASINIFIPKPFSIWENLSLDKEMNLEKKKDIILENIPSKRNIRFSISSTKRSVLEAVISRADRRFSKVIYEVYRKGSEFQADRKYFSWDIWEQAMDKEGIDYGFYLEPKAKNFPWFFIQ